jgi:hypothetical protein
MFKTIQNTLELIRASWRVLQEDRRLIFFPIMSGAAVLIFAALALGVFYSIGTIGRLSDNQTFSAGDAVLAFVVYLAVAFIVIYFNAALIACAYERLKGGSPSLSYGLRASQARMGSIFVWALISATVGVILDAVRQSDNGVARIAGMIASALWAFATFLVLPVLVVEGVSPFSALQRSTALFIQTWGKQAVANFGFSLGYLAVILVAAVPVVIGAAISTEAAIVLGVLISLPVAAVGFAALQAMDGIFKAALYQFASGESGQSYFSRTALSHAYVEKGSRGGWNSAY